MPSTTTENLWYALQVRTRWERCAAASLCGKGYKILLPTYQARRSTRGKSSAVAAPLFPGYVFCHFDINNRLPILVTSGVIAIVGRGRTPVPVDAHEIAALETMVASGIAAEPFRYLEIGQKVRIEDHPLRGVEGILLAFKGQRRIVVSITLLRRSVALEIDSAKVFPVENSQDNHAGMLQLAQCYTA